MIVKLYRGVTLGAAFQASRQRDGGNQATVPRWRVVYVPAPPSWEAETIVIVIASSAVVCSWQECAASGACISDG